jgi:superfamily II DNA or RNA helicase/HKD family nuclease
MTEVNRDKIEKAIASSFIDSRIVSEFEFRPQMIINDPKAGKKIVSEIEKELLNANEFAISVAFITESGIAPLLQTFKLLEERGIRGRILTTNYLSFSEPKALKKLAAFSNVDLRMYYVSGNDAGFHPKAYIFRRDENYRIIIGSANLTASALTKNHEWNVRLISTASGEYTEQIFHEFNKLWKLADSLDKWIDKYEDFYRKQKAYATTATVPRIEVARLKPNLMQLRFMDELLKLYQRGERRALLISATGTGKTYASAFAAREMDPKRVLFLVHREQIAKQAKTTFENVFVNTKSYGLLSGNYREADRDIVFSTIQTISKRDIYRGFQRKHFDLIIIDEVHRAGAETYERVMEYFTPKFWLGMTASPDRTDGFDIYKLFNHNIAYEIRLQQAMEEDLLCPFHYYGITDISIDGVEIGEDSMGETFRSLTSDKRVDYIIEQINYFGFSGDRVKGLIFCSRNEEANTLSEMFQARHYRTVALSGKSGQEEREYAIDRLTTDGHHKPLDYIFTVDVFNEGVDIPEVNQIVMLRPTESAIIFVQQLGRGLRKNPGKEFVIVLDFIANYKNNFLIPIALSGDRTYNKDNIRRYLIDGHKVIPGSSSIHFDEISKKRIFEAINTVKNDSAKLLKGKYRLLKFKLGRIPSIVDFYNHSEIDPLLILQSKTYRNYHEFLTKYEPEYNTRFSGTEEALLTIFSGFPANGQRPHEALILQSLFDNDFVSERLIERLLFERYAVAQSDGSVQSAFDFLCGTFSISPDSKLFEKIIPIKKIKDGVYGKSDGFSAALKNPDFQRQALDLVALGIKKYEDEYAQGIESEGLKIGKKYSRKDVCRILNWAKEENPQNMGGYRIKYGTCPIFVTLNKKENIADSINYEEGFISRRAFDWKTRSGVQLNGKESTQIMNSEETGLKLFLFVKKSDDVDGNDYYYLGRIRPSDWEQQEQSIGEGRTKPIVNFEFELCTPVGEELYDYLTTK